MKKVAKNSGYNKRGCSQENLAFPGRYALPTSYILTCALVRQMVLLSSVAAMVDQISGASIVTEEAWNMESSAERNPHFLSFKMTEEICRRLIQQLPLEARFKFVSVNVREETQLFLFLCVHQQRITVHAVALAFSLG